VPRFNQEPRVTTVAGIITPFPAGPAVPLQRETNRSQYATSSLTVLGFRQNEHDVNSIFEHYIHTLVRQTVERELANIQIDHTRQKEELVQELYEEKHRGHVSI
jgi:hypothetical protein